MSLRKDENAHEGPPDQESAHSIDASGAQGVQEGNNNAQIFGDNNIIGNNNITGTGNTQITYSYGESTTWSDGVAPPPLARVLGKIESPYRGLAAFQEQDAPFFFGREKTVLQTLERMSLLAGNPGILVVTGASGAGKSSLLQAGVVPRLRGEGLASAPDAATWPCLLLRPGSEPLKELALRVALLTGTDAGVILHGLEAAPEEFALTARQAALTQSLVHAGSPGSPRVHDPDGARLLLVVDQFEQVFTRCEDGQERQRFITALHAAAHGPGGTPAALVVLGMRDDFAHRLAEYPELADAVRDHRYLVTPMTERELRLAITEPAKRVDAQVDSELTDVLLAEGTGAGMLPLLSHALDQAWRSRAGHSLTLADYERTGGIEGAVAVSAERAYSALTASQQATARQVFTRLVATGADGTDTADRVPREELTSTDTANVEAVLQAFADERLLTLTADSVEISHEALLTAWPLLHDNWLAQTHAHRVVRTRLREAAREWADRSRDPSYLWSGTLLASAAASAAPSVRLPPLTQPERAFLEASHDSSRRRSRRRRAGLALLCALVLLAAAIGAYSIREQQDNAQHTATVDSTQLAGDADALRATDPGLAAQLAVAAYRDAPTEQASTELYDSLNTPLDTVIGTDGSYVTRVATEADGPLAAAVSRNGLLRVWNLSSPSAPVLDATIQAVSGSIALSPHGGLLAGACPGSDPGLCLWNLANPRHPVLTGRWRSPSGTKLRIASMAISPDGKMLAGASLQGFTLIWSIADSSRPRLIADLPNPTSRTDGGSLAGVAFAPGGRLLAETILGGATRLWSIPGPTRPALMATIQQGYASIAFDPVSSLLAAVGDEDAGLWQVADPRHPRQLKVDDPDTGGDMAAVAFSPDGENVTLTDLDTNDTLGELCTLRIPDELLLGGHVPWVCTSSGVQSWTESYTNAGDLLTGGSDGLVRLWRWPGRPAEGILDGPVASEQVSPDGRLMATVVPRDAVQAANLADDAGSTAPASIDIWSLANPAAPVLDAAIPVNDISLVQFLPAHVLLIADGKGRTRLWDLRNPRHPVSAASLGTAGISKAETAGSNIFGESANHIVGIEDPDGRLHLWRITSPADAVQVGSIPGTPGETGILGDGQTAYRVIGSKIQWWDISNPAHPLHRGNSALPGSGSLDTATAAGTFLVATTTVDLSNSQTGDLVLFDVMRGQVRSTATLSTTVGRWLQVSPASHLLAVAGGGDDAITLWDIADAEHPQRLSIVPTQLGVLGIDFSPDGKVLALSTYTTVQLWDIHNPEEPELLDSITRPDEGDAFTEGTADEPVLGMAFTGQGDTLAISGLLTTSLVDSDPAQLAARLCGYAEAPISPAQWQQDAPGVPYRRPCP